MLHFKIYLKTSFSQVKHLHKNLDQLYFGVKRSNFGTLQVF